MEPSFITPLLDIMSHSYFFLALKIILGIYIAALLIDIVLMVLLRDIKGDIKKDFFGTTYTPLVLPVVSKLNMKRKWMKIENRLQKGNASEYKVTVLEADAFVDSVLEEIGHKGDDMSQKLDQLGILQEADAQTLREAHRIRNQIIFEKDFQLDARKTEELLGVYKGFLKKLDIL